MRLPVIKTIIKLAVGFSTLLGAQLLDILSEGRKDLFGRHWIVAPNCTTNRTDSKY